MDRDRDADRDDRRADTALSFAQQEAWLHARLAGDVPAGNETVAFGCPYDLDVAALQVAFADLLRRHAAWRTSVGVHDGRPVAVVAAPGPVNLPEIDLRGAPDADAEARALARADAVRPFDLEHGPLYRTLLTRLEEGHRLYLTVHRTIADRVALDRLFLFELAALYAARTTGSAPPPEPALQYADFAAREHAWLETAGAEPPLDRWRRRLAGPPATLEPFADRARSPLRGFRGARHPLTLGRGLTAGLRAAARAAGGDLFAALLASFAALLHRYTGEDDVVVGTLADGRTAPALRGLLGCFDNPLALRLDLGDDPSFRVLLARARDVIGDALADRDVPFVRVVEAVQPVRDRARHPLFAHVLTLQAHGPAPPTGWTWLPADLDSGAAIFDLHLDLREGSDDVTGHVVYRTDLFEPATIARLATHVRRLLEAALAAPDAPLSRLSLLDAHERRRVVVEWNRTAHPYPDATVHALVERQAARAPTRVALVAGDRTLAYGELNRRADALAARLRAAGVRRGTVAGVAMERSPEAIVAYLAALKAGAAYLPLSVNDPPERMAFVVADAAAAVVLVRAGTPAPDVGAPVVEVNGADEPAAPVTAAAASDVTPDDLVYVMYTSGSTGRPKGVAVTHRGIVRLLFGREGYTRLGPDEVIAQSTALSFDVAAFEIWGALGHGGRLVLYPSVIPTARELYQVIRRHGVTTMWLTPSIFNLVIEEDPEALAPLRQLDLGGEALSVPHTARAAELLPSTTLYNGYGPTECAVTATGYRIARPVDPTAASIPIGPPIANTTAYVLDRHLQPVPVGVPGELYLGGPGVARGYVNRPEETAARFIADPFAPEPGARLYRTGDLARWRPDGALEYLGRLDSQVKIRGLRIELGEIEAVLAREPSVREAAVVVHGDGAARRLVAYVVGRADGRPGVEALRDHARRLLPAYMVPTAFVPVGALPLTPNGKLDRRALAALGEPPVRAAQPSVAVPAGSLEGQLIDLWQDVLGEPSIGPDDDFFELGGDSLTAARMIQQVGELTGSAVPLGALYECPTVAGLARRLREGTLVPGAGAPAVTLNRGGDRPPLVLFHGMLTGGAFYALRLARHLGPRQPVHVVPPFTGAGRPVPPTIEAMAAAQLDVVRALQPRGPYRLAGYCNGGLVAYEVARYLSAAGETVELVALIAAAPVTPLARTGRILRAAASLTGLPPEPIAEPLARVRSLVEALGELPRRRRLAFVAAKWRLLTRRAPGDDATPPDVMDVYHRVVMRYFPRPAPSPVVVFWPEQEPWGPASAAAAAWRRLVPAVDVHVVPGDHLAVVHDHLDVLVERLVPYLETPVPVSQPVPLTVGERLRLSLPPFVVDLAETMERACEMSLCLA
jgi:amino acid adenylation domain-containing protein